MFERIRPEEAGISSKTVQKFLEKLHQRGAVMHSLLLVRDGKIFAEHYWAPYDQDSLHRMYSQTKSYVAMGIGLLVDEGKLNLDDKIADHFRDKIKGEIPTEVEELTVRNMLTMTTAGNVANWFREKVHDRTEFYFTERTNLRSQGTIWQYDSAGSQVLGALVERLSGMKLLDYLKEKMFNKMGTFKNARILMIPNGDSWGDSALYCTARDMASGGQLLLQGGKWNGEQLLSEQFVKDATSPLVCNQENFMPHALNYAGYGYQIWGAPGGFAFVGMGDQLTICIPDKKFMFVCTADHQVAIGAGTQGSMRTVLVNALYDFIIDNLADAPLERDDEAYADYVNYTSNLKLRASVGSEDSSLREKINGVVYECEKNQMGITSFSFVFKDKTEGEFRYRNAQGDKVIPFGVNHNVFGKFPQLGYSSEMGVLETNDGFMYNDAVSLAWRDDNKLIVDVKIIDKYLGSASFFFGFSGDRAAANFTKAAEAFLEEYSGTLSATAIK